MRVTIVLPGLSNSGGIERVATRHANYLAAGGHEVDLVVFDDPQPPFFPLDDAVAVTNLRSGPWAGPMRRGSQVIRLRAHIRRVRPDVVISIFRNSLVLLATRGLSIPVIITEHMDPGKAWMAPGRRQLQRLLYRHAARLVSVSRGVDRQFHWLDARKRTVIHNAIDTPAGATWAPVLDPRRRHLLAVGRFVEQKGFDLLLEAFGEIAGAHPAWDLCIVGGSPPPDYLRRVRDRGLEGRVTFPGVVRDVSPYYRGAELYVLSSRHEAFPMVLIEAMAHGLPAVAFACPSGPDEIIDDGVDGLLVPPEDVRSLAQAMARAMEDDAWRASAGDRALFASRRFSLESVMPEWDALLSEVTSLGRA